jgi:hypothetical protein
MATLQMVEDVRRLKTKSCYLNTETPKETKVSYLAYPGQGPEGHMWASAIIEWFEYEDEKE